MKKYIAVTILSLAVVILSICARNFDISDGVADTENKINDVDTTLIETIN